MASPNYNYVSDAATWDALVTGTAGNDAEGDDARWFRDYATLTDPVRGLYLDNTSIAKVIFNLLEGK